MSVFDQIKSLIRGGKSNVTSNNNDDASSSKSSSSSSNSNNNSSSGTHSGYSRKQAKKFEAVARLVEEESMAKKRLPAYEGLERYKLVDKLGDGAFSNVYRAVDLETQENVAVKAVRKFELKPQQKASVLKEVQIMRTIKHPSIIQLKNFIETKDHYFLILELCEGGELFHQIVRLTYFSEDLARHCIRQVAEGIRYLHEEKGVVHRDIKPENLLFYPIPFQPRKSAPPPPQPGDEDKEDEGEFIEGVGGGGIGRVKIADFGLSKVIWDKHTMTPCGTVGYTAPEIVKDERYSKSVDMWALGCVLYTLLCGFPPFYDESIPVLTQKVAKGQFTFLSPWWDPISDEAKDLIKHLLCINPDKRYTVDQFLKHPWMLKKSVKSEQDSAVATPIDQPIKPQPTAPQSPEEKATNELQSPGRPLTNVPEQPIESPAKERRRDILSGLSSMKEIFDVSYAVHRMAEERARKKELRRKRQERRENSYVDVFPNSLVNFYPAEDEDDDEDDVERVSETDEPSSEDSKSDTEGVREKVEKLDTKDDGLPKQMLQNLQRDRILQQMKDTNTIKAADTDKTSSSKRSKSGRRMKPIFELNMENATLLGRRKNQTKALN